MKLAQRPQRSSGIPKPLIETAVVILFCAIFIFFVVSHATRTSATYDEATHLPSGYSYLLWNDYRMNPEHPPLLKKWAALPLLLLGVWPPQVELTEQDLAANASQTTLLAKKSWVMGIFDIDAQWLFGHSVLYGLRDEPLKKVQLTNPLQAPGTQLWNKHDFYNDADQLLFWGRVPIMLLGLLLAVLLYRWARELYGMAGAVLALAFFCFDPNFIAHSSLVTTDVGVTAFIFGAVYFLWRFCRRADVLSAAMTMLFFALALAAKFSSVLLIPMFLLIGIGRIASNQDWLVGLEGKWRLTSFSVKGAAFAGLMLACLAAGYVTLWAAYGFRYSAVENPEMAVSQAEAWPDMRVHVKRVGGRLPITEVVERTAVMKSLLSRWDWKANPSGPGETEIQQEHGRQKLGFSGRMIQLTQEKRLLPEAYIYGFAYAEMKSLMRSSYLLGNYSNQGFWYYFPIAFLVKTPLPTIFAIVAAFYFAFRRKDPWHTRLAFIIVPVGFYLLVSMSSSLNIGHRHLLPIYPFLFLMCGGLALEWGKWKSGGTKNIGAAIVLGVIAVSPVVVFFPPWKPAIVFPHYLCYFNELGGGPRYGYNVLVDSNCDWGQGLKSLRKWLKERQIDEPINLSYFGMADPRFHQIQYVNMPGGYPFEPQQRFVSTAGGNITIANARIPGYFAISATHLQGVYFSPRARDLYRQFLKNAKFIDTVGNSIFIYHIDRPPE